jgi:DNA polymerase elongation subunit (family B)
MAYISAQVSENRQSVIVWERDSNGKRDYRVHRAPYYFYHPNDDGDYSDIYDHKLSKLVFNNYKDFYNAKEEFKRSHIKLYESDIGPEFKILSEHYYGKPSGKMNVTFLDIEVDYNKTIGFSTIDNPYAPISAISLYHQWKDKFIVFAVPPSPDWTEEKVWAAMAAQPDRYVYNDDLRKVEMVLCKNETELLRRFLDEIEDTDILSGWNSSWFDCPYIYMRLYNEMGPAAAARLSFPNARPPKIKEKEKFGRVQKTVEFFGRISLDYLEVFIKLEAEKRASNTLEAISEELLPDLKKLEYEGSLHDLYKNDFPFFMRYNIRDTEILKGFDEKLKYIQFAVDFSHHATGLPNNILGTIKLTELAIINHCHYEMNKIVPDSNTDVMGTKFVGAFVLPPQMGMHDWVSGVDIKALYPSAMRSLNVSPECIVGQFVEKNRAYDDFFEEASTRLTLVYEDKTIEVHTPLEWKEIFKERKWAISGYGTVFSQEKRGFLNDIITDWFNKRIQYQGDKKDWSKKLKALEAAEIKDGVAIHHAQEMVDYYDKLQYVYKIRNNSIYGCVGNEFFKFYDLRMAESVTRSGRMILMHMVRTVGELLDGEYAFPTPSALYSDTDSCYFPTYGEDVDSGWRNCALRCAHGVNKSFQAVHATIFPVH